jgi:hypothetical protein
MVRVYLDATGLSIGGAYRAEKERDDLAPRKREGVSAYSGGHC